MTQNDQRGGLLELLYAAKNMAYSVLFNEWFYFQIRKTFRIDC